MTLCPWDNSGQFPLSKSLVTSAKFLLNVHIFTGSGNEDVDM